MDCQIGQEEILSFHFGSIQAKEREIVEQHLHQCAQCLSVYFDLKRDVELGSLSSERPSTKVRKRIRADVEKTFSIRDRTIKIPRRPILLAGLAAAAGWLIWIWVGVPLLQRQHDNVSSTAVIDSGSSTPGHINVL